MRIRTALLSIFVVLAAICACQPDSPFDPGKNEGNGSETIPQNKFSSIEYRGFTFKIRTYLEKTPDAVACIEHAKEDIDEIIALLPANVVAKMQTNPIWFEKEIKDKDGKVVSGAAWYHVSKDYLESQNMMTEKHKCVEIYNYVNYVNWSDQNQPFMILHELCHSYHDRILPNGMQNADVLAAYNNAVKNKMYTNTPYFDGFKTYNLNGKAYAMNDQSEYFSEICEAYWGRNDYYPFDYDDLKEYDAMGFALMEKVWGKRER